MFLSYDGSFEGFLSAAATALRSKTDCSVLRPGAQIPLLPVVEVATEVGLADRMGEFLASRFGPDVPGTVYQAWLSREEGVEDALVGFLRIGLERRVDPSGFRQRPEVASVMKASQRVGREAHRFLGLVRFRLRGTLYVAEIEPDTEILTLIGDHFSERFHDQDFAIHDVGRGTALLHAAEGGWTLVEVSPDAEAARTDKVSDVLAKPDAFETLWKRYYKSMCIEERLNPTCQRNFLPKKHWRHLIEEPGRPPANTRPASSDRR